jgi:RND family efflux transporter MFP subunit
MPSSSRAVFRLLLVALICTLTAFGQVSLPVTGSALDDNSRGSLRSVLRPIADIRVSSRAAGVIEHFHVEEGAALEQGDPILSLDMDAERAELAQAIALVDGAKAELDRTTSEYERARPLSAENIFSEKQLLEALTARDLAASRLAQAEAARDLAQSRLANRTLTSPIKGVFLKTSKSVGEAVERFETVARIVDASRLELLVYADARYFKKFAHGGQAKVRIALPTGGQVVVEGTVSHVDPIVDPATGTFRIRLQFEPTADVAAGYTAILLLPEL